MAREINLVPDIKYEMIKTLKFRNFIFFLCIVVAASALGITAIFGTIAGGQQLAIDSKNTTIEAMSEKLKSFTDLTDYLTIKDQLNDVATITENKKVVSRTFGILSALLPHGDDTITISELTINLTEDDPTFTFDAQANAGTPPYIDYNVLDSFKKSMQYMGYDYGRYIDKEGNEIPAYCMVETDPENGAILRDSEHGFYAYWLINGDGCNPSEELKVSDYVTEPYGETEVVKIWRTPQFEEWYTGKNKRIDLEGQITDVPHFESACITYSGNDTEDKNKPKWTETNECKLVPDGTDGINITESSNGRNSEEDLVLRFSAIITLNPEVFKFNNYHMIALPPSGRFNVTDSFVQIQAMFGERASDCADDDTACKSDNTNRGGQ